MSEQGWRAFLAAPDLEDWVLLHGGATAVFSVASMSDAARLAGELVKVPGVEGSGALLTIGEQQVSVRLTRGLFRLEQRHVEIARAVSQTARALGAVAERGSVQEVQVAISAKPGEIDAGFWRAVLGYSTLDEDNGVDPLGHGSTIWMQDLPPEKSLRHAMHLDVSVARDQAAARVAAAVAAGGRVVQDSAPEAWILADRAGNKVCVAAWPDGGSLQ